MIGDTMWKILGIEPTVEEDEIKSAYRKKLVLTNPEENPEGFKELRQAYEEARKWASEQKKARSPLAQWKFEIEQVYDNFYRRIDKEEWDELLDAEVCTDLDTQEDARMFMIQFFMNHYFIPAFVWKKAWDVMEFEEDYDRLQEQVSCDILTYIQYRGETNDYFDYQLYEGSMDADYDAYMKDIQQLQALIEEEKWEDAKDLILKVQESEIYHPYVKAEFMKYEMAQKDEHWKVLWKELQDELYDDPILLELKSEIACKEGKFEEALEELKKVIKTRKNDARLRLRLVELYQKLGKYEEAKKICLDALDDKVPDERICQSLIDINDQLIPMWKDVPEKQMDLAWCYYQNQKFEECLKVLREMKVTDEWEFDFYNLIARVLLETKDYEEGLEMTKIWIHNIEKLTGDEKDYERKSKRYGYAHFIASMHCMGLHMEEKCEEYLKRALEMDREQMDVLMYLERRMQMMLEQKRYEDCIKEANKALEISEFFYPAYINRQECHYRLFQIQAVIDDFYRAIELAPEQEKPYVTAMQMLMDVAAYEDCKRIIEIGNKNGVQGAEFRFFALDVERFDCEDTRRLLEIAKELQELIEELPEKEAAIDYRLALLYDHVADLETEEEFLQIALLYTMKAIEKDAHAPQYFWMAGDTCKKMGRYEGAINYYKKVLELDENLYDAWIDLGSAYEKNGEYDFAIAAMETGVAQREQHVYAHNALMNLYLKKFSSTREIEYFKKGLSHANRQLEVVENAYFYRERAYLYIENMQYEEALLDIKKSYELDPEELYAISSMGYIYRLMGDYEKAIYYYELAEPKAKTPYQKNALYRWWAPIYECAGQYEKAIGCLKKAEQYSEEGERYDREMAEIYMHLNDYEKAIVHYKKAYQWFGTKEEPEEKRGFVLIDLANAYYCNGNKIRSGQILKKVKSEYGDSGSVLCSLGEFYLEKKRDYAKAGQCYQEACDGTNEEPYVRLVQIYGLMGRMEQAKKMCRIAERRIKHIYGSIEDFLRKKGNQKYVYYNMGLMYYYSGELDTAKRYLENVKERPRCEFCTYGLCYEEEYLKALLEWEDHPEQARKRCEKILQKYPNVGEVQWLKKQLEKRK